MSSDVFKKRSALQGLKLPLLIGIVLIIVLAVVICRTDSEAISPAEILAKENWTDAELQEAMSRVVSPTMTDMHKDEVSRHLSKQLMKRSPEKREQISRDAVVSAVTGSLQQLRKMPPKERSAMLQCIYEKAENAYRKVERGMDARGAMENHLGTRSVDSFVNEVNRVIFAELTPEERVQFAPITKLWVKTIKSMEK